MSAVLDAPVRLSDDHLEAARRVASILDGSASQGPALLPCTCGAPRHQHSGAARAGGCPATGCRRYRREAVDVLVERALAGDQSTLGKDLRRHEALEQKRRRRNRPRVAGEWGVSPSDTSTCRALIGFRERGWGTDPDHVVLSRDMEADEFPEGSVFYRRDIEDKRAAKMGSLIHDGVMRVRRALYPWRVFEIPLAVDGLDRRGRFDEYDPVMGVVNDCKCSTPDTLVLMADGSERRADAVQVGEHVVAWDATTDSLQAARVTYSATNGERPVVTVRVAGGRSLTVTRDHPVLLATQRGDQRTYKWVHAEDVQPGDRVRLALGWQGVGVAYERPTVDGPACKHEGSAPHAARSGGLFCPSHYNAAARALPDAHRPLTPQDAYLLGALVGDGGLTGWADGKDAPLTFTCADADLVAAVGKTLSAFDAALRPSGGCNYRIHFGGSGLRARAFRQWLLRHDLLHGAHDKRVPREVMVGSPEVRASFAAGLLDTDGTVAKRGAVTWVSVSEGLLRDMQTLLAHLGVAATLNKHRSVYAKRPHLSHVLTVKRAMDVAVLAVGLPLSVARKRDRLMVLAGRAEGRGWQRDLARVVAVEVSGDAETWALTVEGMHTHVTSGFVTHNTAGDWKWDLIGADGPPTSEWEQVAIYGLALSRLGVMVRTLRITYVHRARGADEVFERPYDEVFALAAVNRLAAISTGLDAGASMPRDREGPSSDPLCRLCPFRSACWRMPQAERLGRSPESLLALGAEPTDPVVEWALTAYDARRGAATAAKKEQDLAKVLLEGVEHGVYGEFVYGVVTTWKGDLKAQVRMLVEAVQVPLEERPALDVLTTAPKSPQDSISVKRVRAATRERKARSKPVAAAPAAAAEVES